MPRLAMSVRDQHRRLAGLKIVEGSLAGVLALVAVDGFRLDAVAVQALHDLVGAVLGAREDDRAGHRHVFVQVREQGGLVLLLDEVDGLFDRAGEVGDRSDLDRDRVDEELICEFADFERHRRAEQKRLALFGQEGP